MSEDLPLVSIICLCYNQALFIEEAIRSALNQNYPHIQLIVVDDASTDDSQKKISSLLDSFPNVVFIALKNNLGNCKAFNKGLALAKGKYVIDLAGDDVLLNTRVKKGVEVMESLPKEYGVHFSDAAYIDSHSKIIGYHYKRDKNGKLINDVPKGNVYKHVIEKYFICSPTMMMKKEVLDQLGGYDETLSYEDFDFWVRSSRNFLYAFSDEILVKKRVLKASHSKKQVAVRSFALLTNLKVCEKIVELNKTEEENYALSKRLIYETRQCLFTRNYKIAKGFLNLYKKIKGKDTQYWLYLLFILSRTPLFLLNDFRQKPK